MNNPKTKRFCRMMIGEKVYGFYRIFAIYFLTHECATLKQWEIVLYLPS